jgi:hypothetical protein
MQARLAASGAWALVVLSISASAVAESPMDTSFGLELARDWFAREDADAEPATAYRGGAWLLRDVAPALAVGVEINNTVFLFGCRDEPGCYPYNLLRLGGLAELRDSVAADEHQALEVFGSLGPEVVRYARGEHPTRREWGIGVTARIGLRVRMRWLTLAPHAQASAFSPGSHLASGFGLQLGVRVAD